ncbi:MAG: Rhodococcus phage Jace [Actinomycetota bacterium]
MATKNSARRMSGDGSLYLRKDGMWIAALDLGYGPDGKRKRWTGSSRTKDGALAKLRKARGERETIGTPVAKGASVSQYLDDWLESVARPRIRPKTYAEYERCIRLHLKPRLGHERLPQLSPQKIRIMEQALASEYTAATANNVHRCLRTALNDAVADGLIPRNPAEHVTPPRAKKNPRMPLSAEGAAQLLMATVDEPLGSRWAFALLTGTRQGETLGLEWDRVDLEAGTADVAWQLQRLPYRHGCGDRPCGHKRGGNCPKRELDAPDDFEVRSLDGSGLVLTRPKTARSTRMIPLAPALVDALRKHRRTRLGGGLVWTRDDGQPIDPKDDHAAWDALLERLSLPSVTLHGARATTATLLMAQGVDAKVIQDLLGHTSVVTTRGYQHSDDTMTRAAVTALGESLG